MTKKILIVGAGVVGLNTAYAILKKHADAEIAIVDQHDGVATQTSFANGGQVSVCNTAAWNTWGNVWKGMKWAFNPEAPLSLGTDWSSRKISWLADFVKEIRNSDENTNELVAIAQGSRGLYQELFASGAVKLDSLRNNGIVKLYRSEKTFNSGIFEASYFDSFDEFPVINNSATCHPKWVEELTANIRIGELFNKVHGSVFYPKDFSFDLREYCVKMQEFLQSRGVIFKFNCQVFNGLEQRFDSTIYCAGVGMNECGLLNDLNFKIYPVKGYSNTYILNKPLNMNTSILDEDLKIVATPLGDNVLRVAGTAELSGYDYDYGTDHVRNKLLHNWAVENGFVDKYAQFMPYSCLRPMTPNMLPFVRQHDGKIYHGGHGHLGQTLSMQTAAWVANIV